ncbi:4,5:9,10-diseco-3-hydroxy-5,9,17-trioxoandrosta-1(10),2-diene-4-oate hydrolase [Enhygromyxa salina]|uniref:4,5:9,10-diseco-3-hydroxy-5,9, 17-trioxoandrosta-1(10),2-diene-4-oate hydrolase n=1 Tax=Enhygromyxa salina TaxID=215803 RepID=A0A2S9XUP0_9BACT|nr:alpha/beta hydrolase [Enhygromyxa salina]PRP96588.1 4,5:9,10-diseco-3-hydroxy-5,9,17-trioxoandrosta-1(10),2-diene-4-oate hydrolase [Enhygromyxa salina]
MKYRLATALLLVGCSSAPQPASAPGPVEPAAELAASESEAHRFDARLSLYDYPFEVKTYAFEGQSQKLEMAYMDVAPAEANGKTVLLLHGKNFSAAYWVDTINALTAEGYRVIAPDQIGFGKSSKPEHYQFTFHALATNTLNLLDELGVADVSVVGHSMGGMLATRIALMYPERTRQLVLVNPIGLEDWKLKVPYTPVETWYENELDKTPEKVRAYMKASYFDGNWKPEYDRLAEIQTGWTEGPEYERIAWVSALTYDMIFTQPVVYEFGNVAAPTLLIIGDRDRTALGKNLVSEELAATMGLYGELGKRTQAAIPNSELVELAGIGHIPQAEAWPEYIAALTEFLAE